MLSLKDDFLAFQFLPRDAPIGAEPDSINLSLPSGVFISNLSPESLSKYRIQFLSMLLGLLLSAIACGRNFTGSTLSKE